MRTRVSVILALALVLPTLPATGAAGAERQIEEVAPPPESTLADLPLLEPSYRPSNAVAWTARLVTPLTARSLPVAGLLGRRVHRVGVALGAPETPTPRGRLAVYQEMREPSFSPLGPWALHLTAHSNVLFECAGGPGRVAIHGARGALWAEAGTNPSHGCSRVPDPGIGRVAALVTPGTPVVIGR
jgi:lipoprotein-anchoring transpeptidase ErfK/SrfK